MATEYAIKQAKWVKENKLEVGSKVRVTRAAFSYENGWKNSWLADMNKVVGKEVVIRKTDGQHGIQLEDGQLQYNYPYFILEPVPASPAPLFGLEPIVVSNKLDPTPKEESPVVKFKPGQKVTCIDIGANKCYLTPGKVYTVKKTSVEYGLNYVYLESCDSKVSNPAFYARRFKAVVEPKPASEATIAQQAFKALAPLVINEICESTHASNIKAGWWDQADNPLVVPTKIALIVSECAEALEGHRKGLKDDKLPQYDMVAVELADVLIRVFDLAGFLKIPLGTIIADKEAFNASRADHKPEVRKATGGKKY